MFGWADAGRDVGALIAVIGISGLLCLFFFPVWARAIRPAILATRFDIDSPTALLEGRRTGLIGLLLTAVRLNTLSLTVDDAITFKGPRLTNLRDVRRIEFADVASVAVTDAFASEDRLLVGLTIAGGVTFLIPGRGTTLSFATPVLALFVIGAVYFGVLGVATLRIRTRSGGTLAVPVWLDRADPASTMKGLLEIADCIERAARTRA